MGFQVGTAVITWDQAQHLDKFPACGIIRRFYAYLSYSELELIFLRFLGLSGVLIRLGFTGDGVVCYRRENRANIIFKFVQIPS